MGNLASKVKAPRAANAIEAAPEMVVTPKAARAERPVTARIRERVSEPDVEEAKPEPTEANPEPVAGVIPMPVEGKQVDDFRQAVARR